MSISERLNLSFLLPGPCEKQRMQETDMIRKRDKIWQLSGDLHAFANDMERAADKGRLPSKRRLGLLLTRYRDLGLKTEDDS